MTRTLYPDPAAEARARLGRHDSSPIPAAVREDAERQLAAMLAGLNDLVEAVPLLAEPAMWTACRPGAARTAQVAETDRSSGGRAQATAGGASSQPVAAPSGQAPHTGSLRPHTSPAAGGELYALSLVELADLVRRREVSPVEVTRAALDRIERYDGALRTFIVVTADQALDDARRAEAEIAAGAYRGPLHGVPLAAKDLYDVRGVPTTAGSAILRDYVPAEDSAAVAAWRAAGAVLLGKNTLHEFAFGGTSVNQHTGTPRNPWDPARMCGGSSGGSAAAVAAGFAYGAFGSETGNSIRRPASFCGVVGLKPTYGRCSRRGVFPLSWSLDHVGVFARTAADAALLAQPLSGFDPADPGSRHEPGEDVEPGSLAPLPLAGLRGRRVGVPRALLTGVDPEVLSAFEEALDGLRLAGVEVRDVALPLASRWTALASSITMQAEAAAVHGRWVRERPLDYGADVLARLLAGEGVIAADYARAQAIRGALRAELVAMLDEVDAFVAPATPAPAPPLEGGALVAGDNPFGTGVSAFQLQRMWSLTGLPAVSVPAGLHSTGLPMAVQVAARPWEERVALGFAAAAAGAVLQGRRAPAVAPLS
jgi:aspartyl-tRNA(Asn)/glutamyl-tRNA(Gln) amidotransferase subunit A